MDATTLSDGHARLLRLRSQRLDRRGTPEAGVVETVRELCGVHAQLPSSSALTVRPRTSGTLAAEVERCRVERRSLVRTWCMRGTFHLVASDDVRWLLALLGPTLIAGGARRQAQLGLDQDTFDRARRIVRRALEADGPLTRPELAERLAAGGVDPAGQRIAHLVHRFGLEGLVCHGPDRGADPTFVLLDDWIGAAPARRAPDREGALAELARRYLAAYGPAGPRDLAAWSGLGVRDARAAWAAIAGELVEVVVAGEPAWLPAARAAWPREPRPEAPLVHLLAGFDVLLLGYRDRALAVPAGHARAVWTGGGFIKPTLCVDGRAVATWSITRRANGLEVAVEPFGELPDPVRPGLEAEVADLGRFLGQPARLAAGAAG
jgi:hypothetical protein